jgi:hypothetical protein
MYFAYVYENGAMIPVGAGKDIRKGCGRVNVVEILCTHV